MENAPKVTYWACWWKATWVLFLIGCVLGYLNGRGEPGSLIVSYGNDGGEGYVGTWADVDITEHYT